MAFVSPIRSTSLTGRLTLLFALTSFLVMCGIGLHIYSVLEHELDSRGDQELEGKVELVRNLLVDFESVPAVAASPKRWHDVFVGHSGLHLNLFGRDYSLLAATSTLRVPRPLLERYRPADDTPIKARAQLEQSGPHYRFVTAWGYAAGRADKPVLIALAHDETETDAFLATHLRHVVFGILAGSVLAAGAGYFLAWHGLKPIRVVAAASGEITASDLGRRLDLALAPEELKTFVANFNQMLERLQDSFERLSDFSSDIAHEFRTPINNLMGQTQVALSQHRTVEELRDVLGSNVEEYERLARMIDDMLFLARADNAQAVLHRQGVSLGEEASKVLSYFEVLCEERGLHVSCTGDATISADRSMVQRAIANLLSNAIRHSTRGGGLEVRIFTAGDRSVELSVTNAGQDIAQEHLERIFDRFYRVEGSRKDSKPGAGLGLAIVKSIMTLHGGTVTAHSSPGQGTTFTLRFPKQAHVAR